MIVRILLVLFAAAVAFVPLPPSLVEQWYSRGLYPRVQAMLTPVSNLVPIALLDVAAGALVLAGIIRLTRLKGWRERLRRGARALVVSAAALYLAFALLWGLNYRRMRLEDKLAYDTSRVNSAALVALTARAIAQVNALHASAHAATLDSRALANSVADAQQRLGDRHRFVAGVPKRSLLSYGFRLTAVDGMTNPVFLEIILNADVLPFERPMVLAHEWAHLAGYAHEAEANFVAWLACLRADAPARYSAWLATYGHAVSELSRDDRGRLPKLDAGPRDDLRAMAARYARSRPRLRRASRDVYDSYLRANRVDEGIASYGGVLRLILGAEVARF